MLSDRDYSEIVYNWNATELDYAVEETIISLFERQVAETPDQIALVYEDQELSYRELNEKSNQLAVEIRKKYNENTSEDLAPDTLIGLCLERSLEMVIGILSVLKSGGAYVPIDPDYPAERIRFILEDTATSLLLTQEAIAKDQLSDLVKGQVLCIDMTESFYHDNPLSNV